MCRDQQVVVRAHAKPVDVSSVTGNGRSLRRCGLLRTTAAARYPDRQERDEAEGSWFSHVATPGQSPTQGRTDASALPRCKPYRHPPKSYRRGSYERE